MFQRAGAINTGFLELHADEILQKCQKKLNSLQQSICALVVLLVIENRVSRQEMESSFFKYPWSNYSGSWRIGGLEGRHKRTLQQYTHPDEEIEWTNPIMMLECSSNRDGSFDIRTIDSSPFPDISPSSSPATDTSNDKSTTNGEGQYHHLQGSLTDISNYSVSPSYTMEGSSKKLEILVDSCKRVKYSVAWKEDIEKGKISVHVWPDDDDDDNKDEEDSFFGMDFDHPLPVGSFTASKYNKVKTSSSNESSTRKNIIKSPMPGRVTKVYVNPNDSVSMNQVLIVIEAMKMEHSIKSPMSGRISQLNTSVGSVVNDGDVVAIVKEEE